MLCFCFSLPPLAPSPRSDGPSPVDKVGLSEKKPRRLQLQDGPTAGATSADFSPGHTPRPLSASSSTLSSGAFNILIYYRPLSESRCCGDEGITRVGTAQLPQTDGTCLRGALAWSWKDSWRTRIARRAEGSRTLWLIRLRVDVLKRAFFM